MTAYVTATLQNLLLRSLALPFAARSAARRKPRPIPRTHRLEAAITPPFLYRSEGFAEDLLDSHPAH